MNEDILRKLQKLLALSDSAEKIGNQAEAEAAAAKVQALLIQYNLSLSDVKNAAQSKEETMVKGDVKYEEMQGRHESDWVLDLFNCIARHNLCSVIRRTGWSLENRGEYYYLTLVGMKTNAEIVKYTVEQLVPRIRAMAREAFKEYQNQGGQTKKNTWIRGYLRGAVIGLNAKLSSAIKEMQETPEQIESGTITALITTNQLKLKETLDKIFPDRGKLKATKLSGTDGYHKGVKDGREMSIHKGLDDGTDTPVLGKKNKLIN